MKDTDFRVWDEKNEVYIYQTLRDLLDGVGDDCPDCDTNKFRHLILHCQAVAEQYIGKRDKNRVKIYEGDKVTIYFGELPSTLTATAEIVYLLQQCQFVAEGSGKDKNKGPWSIDSKHIEVIEKTKCEK
ncbi:MAG: YopX family protein [Candidatus Scalindua sp.]